ncbi:MAG TPA: cytosolic protein, partial [Anaerolineae bacterium]|nr:cytosolic protein [Anaerolineae bacterium]
NEELAAEYDRALNLFTQQFMNDFCVDGVIDWEKLVRFNSGKPISKSKK